MQAGPVKREITGGVALEPMDAAQLPPQSVAARQSPLRVALLTGGQDPHYAIGLGTALTEQNVELDVIGSDEIHGPGFQGNPYLRFLSLHGNQRSRGVLGKLVGIASFYARLTYYALTAKPRVFHVLWNNKLPFLD